MEATESKINRLAGILQKHAGPKATQLEEVWKKIARNTFERPKRMESFQVFQLGKLLERECVRAKKERDLPALEFANAVKIYFLKSV